MRGFRVFSACLAGSLVFGSAAYAQRTYPANDTLYGLQWAPMSMEAPAAWAAGCTGAGARVAILDGGIHSIHADLAADIDIAYSTSFVPGQPFNSDTGTFWHGTHVARIVGARDNNTGVVGIAPEATLIGVKVLHGGGGQFSQAGELYQLRQLACQRSRAGRRLCLSRQRELHTARQRGHSQRALLGVRHGSLHCATIRCID